ncbi:hypothetical protein G9C85_14025 [Halorubellus sp. JP-L1]|uniref:hypothetical protein n=1 Tax=Halorubellus sp. JP-L1 TaxID=2715753 RepID=UPI00140E888D|nr:hypothetical protein [Halorubellus sp. JP-L1]NHN42740.1 hypothetical protein [Halorubellus sp. JP-L1]
MGGMKSGTGDVWGGDDDDEQSEAEADESEAVDAESGQVETESRGSDRSETGGRATESRSEAASPGGTDAIATESNGESDDVEKNDIANSGSSEGIGSRSDDAEKPGDDTEQPGGDVERSGDDTEQSGGGTEQPYVVRRMLKDKSVQFERDERLTLFVHDDVKVGEQQLEAEAQELFGRDIPVFDIREAVYRAALRNRDAVVEELETMGYTRED